MGLGLGHKKASLMWTLVIHFVVAISSTESGARQHVNAKEVAPAVHMNFEESFRHLLATLAENPKSLLMQDVTSDCVEHFNAWVLNLGEEWSIRMLDAMSKIPEGILTGHTTSLGDFDECLAVRGQVNISDGDGSSLSNFKGQYCRVTAYPQEICDLYSGAMDRFKLTSAPGAGARAPIFEAGVFPSGALCIPSKCSKEDLQTILALAAAAGNLTGVCMAVGDCQTDDRPNLRTGDIVMVSILAVIGALCVIGTATDLLLLQDKTGRVSKAMQALLAFSFFTNTRKWLNTSGGGDQLGCVHGIRFLSACWVVLAHTWSTWDVKIWNLADLVQLHKDWTIYPILNGSVCVDTFFTLSGLLAAYTILKMLDRSKGRLNVPMLYLHRYLRLTPTYALIIGIMATWFEYLKPGPDTHELAVAGSCCRTNWWHNLLYFNNLYEYPLIDPGKWMCHGESWYLGNDMQFFLVSPLLLWPLWKWPMAGRVVMGAVTVASVVVPFVVTYVNELMPTLLLVSDPLRLIDFFYKSYFKPWMRFGPYAVGLWAGYLLYMLRKRTTPLRLPSLVVVVGWAASTAIALAILFGPQTLFDVEAEYDRVASAFYAGFHRFAWGVSIAWVVLACTLGYGGFINRFLSWSPFVPLGRLTFCVYLLSYWLQQLYYFSARQHLTYDRYTGINHFFGHLVMSLLVSFVACMAFESPFIALEKIVFGGEKPARKQPSAPTPAAESRVDQQEPANKQV